MAETHTNKIFTDKKQHTLSERLSKTQKTAPNNTYKDKKNYSGQGPILPLTQQPGRINRDRSAEIPI